MAVPSVTSITPSKGPTGGRTLVEIIGVDFALPAFPPPPGPPGPAVPSVEVTFGGVASSRVDVVSSTRLFALAPRSPLTPVKPAYGEGDVDVSVQNLDGNGDPIGGEAVIVTDGYRYQRPQLADESGLTRVSRTLIREFRLQVHPNVSTTTHSDFDDDTADLLNTTGLASLPGIALIGPALVENRFYSQNARLTVPGGAAQEVLERRHPYTVDLEWEVLGLAELTTELHNMMAAVISMFNRTKFLPMLADPSDPSKGTVEYELDFVPDGEPATRSVPNNSNLRAFSGTFVLRGFDVEDLATFPGDLVVAATAETDDQGVRLETEAVD